MRARSGIPDLPGLILKISPNLALPLPVSDVAAGMGARRALIVAWIPAI
jgi:hypothetical protein